MLQREGGASAAWLGVRAGAAARLAILRMRSLKPAAGKSASTRAGLETPKYGSITSQKYGTVAPQKPARGISSSRASARRIDPEDAKIWKDEGSY